MGDKTSGNLAPGRQSEDSRRRPRPALLAVALLGSAAIASAAAAGRPAVDRALAELRSTAGPVTAEVSPITGLVTFLTPGPRPVTVAAAPAEAAETRARAFLAAHGAAFGVARPDEVSVRRSTGPDEVGIEHVRLRQMHAGLPVSGGELAVHLRGATVVAANAVTVPDLAAVDTVPALDAAAAADRSRAGLAPLLGSGAFQLSEGRLELFNRGLLEGRSTPTRLAWFFEARGADLRQYLWIDAETGVILLRFSQLSRALERRVYDALGDDSLPGTLARDDGAAATGDLDVDAAYDCAGDFWEYLWTHHQRDSYDGAGGALISSVRYCPGGSCPYGNAFWNGSQVVFGAGLPAADDVAVHELSHGLIEHTADLFYYMQSGALSESYADILGEVVDQANGTGTDTAEVRWLLGEDAPGGASRDMMNPAAFGHPGSMRDWRFVCEDPGDDGGGVHSNSGVPNHAFALMADGGDFNGRAIAGIGVDKAADVQFRALAHYLLSASGFRDNDLALRQACQDLVGTGGLTAEDCLEVAAALEAVEMSQPWCGESSTAPVLCPADAVTTTLWADDLEGGAGSWSASADVGDNVWGWGHDFASSGSSHLWGDLRPHCDELGWGYTTDSSVAMVVDVGVPYGGAHLEFAHAFGFENYSEFPPEEFYDGGVVEYSVNGGAGWFDAGPLLVAGARYGGVIDDNFGNPLGGREAFVGDSWGYTSTQLDLTPLAGLDVRLRFRIGTDDTTDFCDYGWFVDDVRVFECPAACLRMPVSGCLDCAPALTLVAPGLVSGFVQHVGCDVIVAGAGFGVADDGELELIAPVVELIDGFSVEAGGKLRIATR